MASNIHELVAAGSRSEEPSARVPVEWRPTPGGSRSIWAVAPSTRYSSDEHSREDRSLSPAPRTQQARPLNDCTQRRHEPYKDQGAVLGLKTLPGSTFEPEHTVSQSASVCALSLRNTSAQRMQDRRRPLTLKAPGTPTTGPALFDTFGPQAME